jgi:polyvinyl alcohol dehydrogenase (cytochrome)
MSCTSRYFPIISMFIAGALAIHVTIAADATFPSASAAPPGKALFDNNCAECHARGVSGAPFRGQLMQLSPSYIYNVLTKGAMQLQASSLSDQGRQQVVEYLTGRNPAESGHTPLVMCADEVTQFDPKETPVGVGWGIDAQNTRSIPAAQARLTAKDLGGLKLRWAFGFPDSIGVRSQPLVVGNSLFVGSQSGTIYAMNARSGCVHWTFQAAAEIRGALVYRSADTSAGKSQADPTIVFGDFSAHVYAIDAATGALLWRVKVDDHPAARIVGSPVISHDRIYVPIGSPAEEALAARDDYPCCTSRGSITALDRLTGATLWKRYAIPTPAVRQDSDISGKPHFGPSGASVWSSPAIDEKRASLYFATGNNYSGPADDNSDAIFSIDLVTGAVKWKRQTLANDLWNIGCTWHAVSSCPGDGGVDADFTAPPILVHGKNGRDILLAGQKSGDVFGIDPDTGDILWRSRISQDPDPMSGAIWFGMVVQGETVFVPIMGVAGTSGVTPMRTAVTGPWYESIKPSAVNGMHALNAFTGKRLWSAPVENYCATKTPCAGIRMAPIAIPGAVVAGFFDGYVRAFDVQTGKILWSVDTAQEFKALNGDPVFGGTVTGGGAVMVANGMLYVFSARNGKSDGALLAFATQSLH